MRGGTEFVSKTPFQKRLEKRLWLATSQSDHRRNQRLWRRMSMLLSSIYFGSFFLHTDNPIVIGGGLAISLGCAYGAGLSEFGRTSPAGNAEEDGESP